MEKLRVVSIIIQDGQGGIEAVSKLNYESEVACINITPRSGILGSQYGVIFRPFRAARLLKNADIIVTNLPFHHMLFFVLNLFFRRKHIAVEHGPWLLVLGWRAPIVFVWIYQLWLKKTTIPFVLVAKDLLALYNLVRTNNLYIPNAVAPVKNYPENTKREHKSRFVFAGRFSHEKDVRLALQAFQHYSSQSKKTCSFDLFGSGTKLEQLKDEFGSADNIFFRGYDPRIREKLCEYDVCLVTSWFEGLPGIVLEALSAGLNVVCTPFFSGLTELAEFSCVTISENRDPIKLADAMEKSVNSVINQPSDRNAVETRYAVSVIRLKYQNLFQNLAEDKPIYT